MRKLFVYSVNFALIVWSLALASSSSTSASSRGGEPRGADWQPGFTAWGGPDLQGLWSLDEMDGVPLERPEGATAEA